MDKTTEQAPTWDKEYEYDSLIAPLMAEILSVCKMHDIPMFATFQFKGGPAHEDTSLVTSKIVPDLPGVEQELLQNLDRVARHGWGVHPQTFAMTITSTSKVSR